jgi:hypothetical protein
MLWLWRTIHGSISSVGGEHRGHIRIWLILLFFAMLPCRAADGGLSIPAVLPMAFRIEWQSLSDGTGCPEAVKLAVITVKGRCDAPQGSSFAALAKLWHLGKSTYKATDLVSNEFQLENIPKARGLFWSDAT